MRTQPVPPVESSPSIHPTPNLPITCSLYVAPEASEVNECPDSRPAVGSVVVTLEAREKLVIGAFISDEVDGEWEYWEGEFGPPELEAHVRTSYDMKVVVCPRAGWCSARLRASRGLLCLS